MSDDYAHQILVEAVEKLISVHVTDPNDWDGDEAAETIYADFLSWLPDLIRHEDAVRLRLRAAEHGDSFNGFPAQALRVAAEEIEPFIVMPDSLGIPSWYRKKDGRLVPHRVLDDPTPDEQKERTSQ